MRYAAALTALASLTLCAPQPARAKCRSWSVTTVPAHGARKVPTNVKLLLVVFSFAQQQTVARALGSCSLASGAHRVPLKVSVLPASKRSYRNLYLSLEPRGRLRPNRRYRLRLGGSRQALRPPLDRIVRKLSRYAFRTGAGPDLKAPRRPQRPFAARYSFRRLGCGPAESIDFKLKPLADDRTPAQRIKLRLEVVEKQQRAAHSFALLLPPPWSPGQAGLGHGMCSGNFRLARGAVYTIRVRAVDHAGNASPPSPAITVAVPAVP